jgi:hypothetical protein
MHFNLLCFNYRKNVSGGIFKPNDLCPFAVKYLFFISFYIAVILFMINTFIN